MSDRPLDINLSTKTDKNIKTANVVPTPEEFKKRLATVLDRGWAVDRLTVTAPDGFWGEWVPKDDASQARAQTLGFEDASHLIAASRAINNDGSKSGVGDVVYMLQPMWMHEMVEAKRADDYRRNHQNTKFQKEEKDFLKKNAEIDQPVQSTSEALNANAAAIKEAITPKK